MTDRDKIRERIRALRAKTAARGCTEQEAMAAAEKAAELMREYGVAEHEVEMERADASSRAGHTSVRAKLWNAIAHYTNCAVIVHGSTSCPTYTYFGEGPGPDVAAYLMDVCDRAIDRAVREFRATTWYKRRRTVAAKRRASDDFTSGMVARLTTRLKALFHGSVDAAAGARAMVALQATFRSAKEFDYRSAPGRYDEAEAAGWSAGKDVGLHHGVGGSAPKAIGAKP